MICHLRTNWRVSKETFERCKKLSEGWERGVIIKGKNGGLVLKLTKGWPPTETKQIELEGATICSPVSTDFEIQRSHIGGWKTFIKGCPSEEAVLEHLELCKKSWPTWHLRAVKIVTDVVEVTKDKKA